MVWVYNISNPDAPTDAPQLIAASVVMTALALLVVILRVYVRWGMLNVFGIDDGIIVFSWLTSAGFTAVTCIQTRYGLGLRDITDLPLEDIKTFGVLQFAGAPFYISSILSFKLSLLFSYLRFMQKGVYRYATHVVIVLTALFHLAFLVTQINLCNPIQAQWDTSIPGFTCLPAVTVYTSMASLTILFDVIVMVLPFPVLLGLQMRDRKKAVVLGLFGLGVFITVIQVIRIQTVKRLSVYTDSAPLILWSSVEANLGIAVASIPCLSPLVKYFQERTTNASQSRRKTGASSGYHVGSQYTLQTWKGKKDGNRRSEDCELGNATTAKGRSGASGTDSTDCIILDTTGIVRKTEVTITRE